MVHAVYVTGAADNRNEIRYEGYAQVMDSSFPEKE